jgi:LUC7 N_terminus
VRVECVCMRGCCTQKRGLFAVFGRWFNSEDIVRHRRPPRRLDDPKLCKNFLLGFCPAEEFQRTKHDYGTCTLDHDEAAKAQVRLLILLVVVVRHKHYALPSLHVLWRAAVVRRRCLGNSETPLRIAAIELLGTSWDFLCKYGLLVRSGMRWTNGRRTASATRGSSSASWTA